jgi:hypothetical protein
MKAGSERLSTDAPSPPEMSARLLIHYQGQPINAIS